LNLNITTNPLLNASTAVEDIVGIKEHRKLTPSEFVWNEGGVVPATCYLLPAPYTTMCDFCLQFTENIIHSKWYQIVFDDTSAV
jgi:hypothetical protein